METSSIPETKMLTLRIGPCQMLKMTFIIGLLVGLYCSFLLQSCHFSVFPLLYIMVSHLHHSPFL